jgi:hypothetical protein
MAQKIFAAALLALVLSGCTSGRFVGFQECALDHSPVWWEFPNSSGSYDGLAVNAANCNK